MSLSCTDCSPPGRRPSERQKARNASRIPCSCFSLLPLQHQPPHSSRINRQPSMNAAMRSPETYSLMSSVCPEKVSMSTGISHSTGSVSAKTIHRAERHFRYHKMRLGHKMSTRLKHLHLALVQHCRNTVRPVKHIFCSYPAVSQNITTPPCMPAVCSTHRI